MNHPFIIHLEIGSELPGRKNFPIIDAQLVFCCFVDLVWLCLSAEYTFIANRCSVDQPVTSQLDVIA